MKKALPRPVNPGAYANPLRVLTAGVTFTLALFAAGWSLAVPATEPTTTTGLLAAAYIGLGLLIHVLLRLLGHRVGALAPGRSRAETGGEALTRHFYAHCTRMVGAATPGLIAYAHADRTWAPDVAAYLVATAVSGVLLVAHALPRPANALRVQRALDADGADSRLVELLGFEPWTGTDADLPVFPDGKAARPASALQETP